MEQDQQQLVDALAGGGAPISPPQPPTTSGLSPEAMAALFLVPGVNMVWDKENNVPKPVSTVPGEAGRYNIMHDKQGRVGDALLNYDPQKKTVKVDYVSAPTGLNKDTNPRGMPSWLSASSKGNEWAHNLGTSEVRSLLKSLAKTFPDAEKVEGVRISGARELRPTVPPAGFQGVNASVNIPRSQGFGGPPGQKITDLW